ncbi:hypothetical protein K2W90_01160 [Candidatus Babeliales bacterium]|nr:hypothetical protein [Candidatus Babeliales bacterium]
MKFLFVATMLFVTALTSIHGAYSASSALDLSFPIPLPEVQSRLGLRGTFERVWDQAFNVRMKSTGLIFCSHWRDDSNYVPRKGVAVMVLSDFVQVIHKPIGIDDEHLMYEYRLTEHQCSKFKKDPEPFLLCVYEDSAKVLWRILFYRCGHVVAPGAARWQTFRRIFEKKT